MRTRVLLPGPCRRARSSAIPAVAAHRPIVARPTCARARRAVRRVDYDMASARSTRREFLTAGFGAAVAGSAGGAINAQGLSAEAADSLLSDAGRQLRRRFPDLRRHLVFEYYPWYATDPFLHWQQWDRVPPLDLAANTVPHLGAYDSRSVAVLEQHARWIADAGVGAINVSWWGRGRFEDRSVHLLMDVMRDHDIRVTFHLEPYALDRAERFPSDVLYLLDEYGEKRGWDCFLMHQWADGSTGPIIKLFKSLLPRDIVDCMGERVRLANYVHESVWRHVTDEVRETLRHDFDRLTILSESPDARRVRAAGFDGVAIYGPDVPRENWLEWALEASRQDLVFTFNVNPGMDEIARRTVEFGSCYTPRQFIPPTRPIDWSASDDREHAARLSTQQIDETLLHTLSLQTHPWLSNVDKGFFVLYVCSFNEWHEGHQFEPMRDGGALTPEERAHRYHNPQDGSYRLRHLTERLARLL